jgi:hypothetical protein
VYRRETKTTKMKKSILLITLLYSFYSCAQTKKIFHKSHSGKSSTLFMDAKNNFGPGMAPVRYRTPISPIKLNYAVTQNNEYPLVKLDTVKKTMRFFDFKDSLLGCDRNYKEYITHGDIIFDIITNEFYVYQTYFKTEQNPNYIKTEHFLPISDSIPVWENRTNTIRTRRHFIRDGNNHRILMAYPQLNNRLTYTLQYYAPEILQDAQPILIDNDLEKTDEKLLKEEKRRVRKLEKKEIKFKQKEEGNAVLISPNFPLNKSNYLLRWLSLILLVFSLFIFVGVQRIVKDELNQNKQ